MRLATGFSVLLMPILLSSAPATADSGNAGPALGVARVSVVNGDVVTRRGDSGDWVAAKVNMPVVEGDSLQVTGGSRAEVQLDHGNFVRLAGDTDIQFLELGSDRFRIRVSRGTAIYSELEESAADIDIETPLVAIRPMKAGRYKVTVGPHSTIVEVRQGETEIAFEHSTSTLSKGDAMTVWKTVTGIKFEVGRAGSGDSFDKWAANRDKALRRAVSYRYVSRDIYGAAALDHHGSWRYVSNVGYCWFPQVTASWVPYRHGRWIWLDYYGWTWVGDEPWGWAPYHWGRWHNHAVHGWGWFPGHPRLRHVWRPALVAFFGVELGVRPRVWAGFGGIGWAPLGPGELYSPWYGGRYYGNNTIVIDNSVRVFNAYSNARDRRAVSYIDSRQFALGSTHTPRALRTGEIREAAAIRGPLPVVPDRASQGVVLRASSGLRGTSTLQSLRRGYGSHLRDGTARISFDDQRTRMRNSVEAFYKGYRTQGAPVASNSGVRARRDPSAADAAVGKGPAPRPAVPSVAPVPANRQAPPLPTRRREGIASTGALESTSTVRGRGPVAGAQSSSTTRVPSADTVATGSVGLATAPIGETLGTPTSVGAPTANPRPTNARPGTSVRIPNRPGTTGQARSPSTVPSATYPAQSARVPGLTPTTPGSVVGGPSPGTASSVYAPRTNSRIGAPTNGAGTRPAGTRSRPTGNRGTAASRSRPSARVGGSPTGPTASRQTPPSAGSTGIRTPRVPAGSSTSVYAPRSRSRIGTYQVPRTSSRAPSARGNRVPSSSSRTRSRVSPRFPSGSRGTGAPRQSAPSARTPRSSSRSPSAGGTFGNRGQRGSRSNAPSGGFGGRGSPRSSSPRSTGSRVGGLSTHRSGRVGSSAPRMSSPRPSSGGSRPSSGGSRPSYSGSRGSSSRPSGSSRSGSWSGPGAGSSSSRPGKDSDR